MLYLPNPFWLIITNSLLGILVLSCLFIVIILLVREIALHARYMHSRRVNGTIRKFVSRLGITMADGGEPADDGALTSKRKTGKKDRKAD